MDPLSAIIVLALLTVVLILWIKALGGIANHPVHEPAAKAVWVLTVTDFPLIGSIIWFTIGAKTLTRF